MNRKLTDIARQSIKAYLNGGKFDPAPVEGEENPNGIFVTLWTPGGQLRGCIGRHHREFEELSEEVADCAILSATEDPRFPTVSAEELPALGIEISLLGKPELVKDLGELDPKIYGVIVEDGRRKATLLPGIEGVDTVEQQTRIVLQKAGIYKNAESVTWYRFIVKKVSE